MASLADSGWILILVHVDQKEVLWVSEALNTENQMGHLERYPATPEGHGYIKGDQPIVEAVRGKLVIY